MCQWYQDAPRPLCNNQDSGWGWENQTSCIGITTCASQSGDGGVVQECTGNTDSSTPTSSSTMSSSSWTSSNLSGSALHVSSSSVSAISSSVPTDTALVLAVNAGSGSTAMYNGVQYQAYRYSTGGTTNSTTDAIAGVADGALFQSERYGSYSYEIPVTAATYSINLHFVEFYWDATGDRSFNVTVEGDSVLTNVDLFSLVGHDGAYTFEVNNVAVSDGYLSISLETQTDNATLSGFALYSPNGQITVPASSSAASTSSSGNTTNGDFCPDNAPCHILPLGDSITDGLTTPRGYRIELFSSTLQSGLDIDFVGGSSNGPSNIDGVPFPSAHEGHSGWTVQQINDLVNQGALNVDPNIILLHIGTNDMISNAFLNSCPSYPKTLLPSFGRKIFYRPTSKASLAALRHSLDK